MAAGTRAGQSWDRAVEIKTTRERFHSTLRNHLLKNYDPASGEIPACIPVERQARWVEIIDAGGRPDIGLNAQGLYVRKAQGSKTADNDSYADTDKPAAGLALPHETPRLMPVEAPLELTPRKSKSSLYRPLWSGNERARIGCYWSRHSGSCLAA
jgi:hypothetical protein